ncbi:LytR/AlgR family response regulator transcription factor [Roseateles sp. DB2]|uniref:LytR/AlgR family response regulator transcription factor n=1 Tax=Roseateles sp. DB2 TaxID=3453717 RepID=UPI003EEE045D
MTEPLLALIVEDEPVLARRLQEQLLALWPGLDMLPTADNGAAAIALALEHLPRMIFMDIHMPACSGLEAAQAILEEWPEGIALPLLVFVTAYGHYALQAFDHGAIDYLLKPLSQDRLQRTIQRLQDRLALSRATGDAHTADDVGAELRRLDGVLRPQAPGGEPLSVINAAVGSVTYLIPLADVLYFEAADKYVRVVTRQREALIRMALRDLVLRLDPQRFWQLHRSVVVQASAIAHVARHDNGRLSAGLHGHDAQLPVSRLFAHRFRAM